MSAYFCFEHVFFFGSEAIRCRTNILGCEAVPSIIDSQHDRCQHSQSPSSLHRPLRIDNYDQQLPGNQPHPDACASPRSDLCAGHVLVSATAPAKRHPSPRRQASQRRWPLDRFSVASPHAFEQACWPTLVRERARASSVPRRSASRRTG